MLQITGLTPLEGYRSNEYCYLNNWADNVTWHLSIERKVISMTNRNHHQGRYRRWRNSHYIPKSDVRDIVSQRTVFIENFFNYQHETISQLGRAKAKSSIMTAI